MAIKGIKKLSEDQVNLLMEVNKRHTACVGTDYKDGMEITQTWLENGTVCARLKNGEWYHYYKNYTWG